MSKWGRFYILSPLMYDQWLWMILHCPLILT
jgi:hypothetical protein